MSQYGRYILDLPHTAYDEKGKTPVLSPALGQQLGLYSVTLLNRAAAPQSMGAAIRSPSSDYKVMQYTAVGPVYTDVSTALAAGTATTLVTTTNNDGFVVGNRNKFNLIGLTVSQAGSGGAPVYAYEYWNGAAWTACPAVEDTPNYALTGDILFVHLAPHKWLPGGPPGLTGPEASYYYLRIRATTAPAQAMQATAIWVARFMYYGTSIPTNGILQIQFPYDEPRTLGGGETVIPYFATADVKNCISAQYQSR